MTYRQLRPALTVLLLLWGAVATPAQAADKHFLWKATGGKGVVYLLGTIHVGKAALYPLPAVIEDSFKAADTLVVEVDLTGGGQSQQAAKDAAAAGTYANGDSINNHIGEKTREKLAAFAKQNHLGDSYTHAKPWLLSMLILQLEVKRMGLDPSQGLDNHFMQEAVKLKKPIAALETADFQLKLISSFPDKLQDELLLTTLLQSEQAGEIMDKTVQAWRTGDAEAMQRVITKQVQQYPFLEPVMDKLFYERNDAMTRKIEDYLKTGKNYFVAVGAGHLTGPRGILAQLKAKSYTIEQM